MDPTRSEIMAEVVTIKALMVAVVYWSQVQGWLIVGATVTVIALVVYQIWLKHRENARTNAALAELASLLAEVKEYLNLAKKHGELTDLQKNAMLTQLAEFVHVSRLQASKVALSAEKSVGEVKEKLDRMPEKTATLTADRVVEKMAAKSAEDSGIMPVPKIAPEGQ